MHTHANTNAHIHTNTCKYTQSIWYHWLVSSGLAPVRAWRVWAVIRHPAVFLCQQGLLSAWLSASQDNVTHTYTHSDTNVRAAKRGISLTNGRGIIEIVLNYTLNVPVEYEGWCVDQFIWGMKKTPQMESIYLCIWSFSVSPKKM